jgi:hypothetical protein
MLRDYAGQDRVAFSTMSVRRPPEERTYRDRRS